ncbi:MAG TPA: endonuclease/exonuclease/phosphatase family protein, partial [Verrucomicrobiae bacterium]
VAHLKSRRPVPDADEAQERLGEAKILRGIIDEHFKASPDARLVLLGDFNDVKDSDPVKTVIGRGRFMLTDTRPGERNGDNAPAENSHYDPRNVTWTEYYGKEDAYTRMDYIFISPALARDWVKEQTYIPTIPNWGIGSDHRPILAAFEEE